MSRRSFLSLVCLTIAVVFVQLSSANTRFSVNESATKFLIQDQTVVLLEAVNPAPQSLRVKLQLDLLDPKDLIEGRAVRELTLQPGVNQLSIPLTLAPEHINKDKDENLPWYRLRYRIDALPEITAPPEAASGLISLSAIDTPDIFALEVSIPRAAHPGSNQYTHIRTLHPLTGKPVKDVNITVELSLDGEPQQILRGSAVSDAHGYALVALKIPNKPSDDEGELKVVARHGGFVREASEDIDLDETAQILITTDKPIYQPGQPLHVRALVFNAAKRAAVNAKTTLKITDPEGTTVFQTDLVTSRFGIANADWSIPDNTRLGDYQISVEMDDENFSNSAGYEAVKISRYDLPNFTVSVKPDRNYYLPQQNATIEVRADYLFAQPVKRGHVRLVREEERSWNYREQKWDVTAGENYEGETDEAGRFVAQVDLGKYHEELAGEDYSRFNDLHYAAYYTDATTNRTEQRRFDLRITKEPIHIYVTEGVDRQAPNFPMRFYVATSYADGTPVSCDVAINQASAKDEAAPGAFLQTVHTNKYGIAKVNGLMLPDTGDKNPSLNFTARDDRNQTGHHAESFYYAEVPVVRVETDKALYRPGETINARITASVPNLNLFVDVAREGATIESRSITLSDGTATLSLPWRREYRDEVSIAAYTKSPEFLNRYYFSLGARTVLFPRDRDLKLDFHLDQASYKPGEDATIDFHVLTPEGRPATSALGIVVFDRAVEERARTDQEFGGRFGFSGSYSRWRGYDNQVAGITRKTLQQLDLHKPLPAETDLIAELLLNSSSAQPTFFDVASFATDHREVFSELTGQDVKPLQDILEREYKNAGAYPENHETLRRLLFEAGVDIEQLRDPWGTPYRHAFSSDRENAVHEVLSAGPDKVFATKDDFSVSRTTRPYFRFTGEAINRAVERFHARNGGFIRDASTLKNELRLEGIDFDSLRDPWGGPYELSFSTARERFNLAVNSAGPNQRFDGSQALSDDFVVWVTGIDYLREIRPRVSQALADYFTTTNTLPHDDMELRRALADVDQQTLNDPWGHRYYAVYKLSSGYSDRVRLQTLAKYGQPLKAHTEITPVTRYIFSIKLRSSGEDGKEGTADDFDAVEFSQLTAEEARDQQIAHPARPIYFSGSTGALKGTVIDPAGAVVPGAKVKATLQPTLQDFETESDDSGRFLLRNLPAGFYTVRCDSPGFKSAVVTDVPITSSNITTLDLTLDAGAVSEVVTVSAERGSMIDGSESQVSKTVSEGRMKVSIGAAAQLSTPRLREYFPETLVWQPALETDKQGRAQLKFKLADNITTWKLSVIGSTETGELGTAEAEIKSFQPFFIEHDPPRILTEGDQISLPVVLRNYLERPQTVDLEITPEHWFTLQGPAHQRVEVAAGDAARQIFEMRAVASIKDGKQRLTARSSEAGDAIEKPVTVHPDGEEKTQTAGDVFSDALTLNMDVPPSAIPGSTQAELKIYPSLLAHVVESIDGILERPHGCGEQTISSTYPSLVLLRRDRALGNRSELGRKAQRYAELGYQRLLNYRAEDGGFTYWGHGEADLALTAYALRFLHDAQDFVTVDDEVIKGARAWLIKQQLADGSWPASEYPNEPRLNQRRKALLTAFVARVLALTERSPKQKASAAVSPELRHALAYLSARVAEIDEPYLLASYALAAMDAGDDVAAAQAVTKLRSIAQQEAGTTYWKLETNTPFHGWGIAGRVETTALAVQALARYARTKTIETGQPPEPLVRSGLLFLLRQKDRYGVWCSTQATINVLDTLVTLLNDGSSSSQRSRVEVVVNGKAANAVELPPGNQIADLIRVDLSGFLHSGANSIELRRPSGSAFASVQLVANYYVPWSASDSTEVKERESGSLRLATTFDKKAAKINEEIICHVKAERVGFSGYGMMLAEIGLPPGADVDRASLETAMKGSGWAITQYDVLPDRVVVYLWPRAGGVDFNFKFRPRFALTAKAAPSTVYDYYNPDARAVVAPQTFVVR